MISLKSLVFPIFCGMALVAPLHAGNPILIDFGIAAGNAAQGAPTVSPDSNGHYWNNVTSTAVASPIAGGTGLRLNNLVDTANLKTPVSLTLSNGWKSSGIGYGGLTTPDPSLLGDFAVSTATQDYYFVDGVGSSATVTISGLNPEKTYNFRFFGTRNTTDIRQTTYGITAPAGSGSATLQTSGAGSGSAGNGNDNTIVELNGVQADTASQVRLQVSVTGGNFAYLGVMEITEADSAPRLASSRTVRVDFGPADGNGGVGPADGNGNPTNNPDSFGNFWNNVSSAFTVDPGKWAAGLVATDNTATGIGLAFSAGWKTNGIQNGGLIAPEVTRLGDLAVATATQDYFFLEGSTAKGSLTITGLNPAKRYNLRLFGTRNTAEIRKTTFAATASSGTTSGELQSSGTDIGSDGAYDGNDNTVLVLPDIQPDLSREIQLQVSTTAGGFSYLGALEITESIVDFPTLAATPPAAEQAVGRWVQQDVLDPVAVGSLLAVGSSSIRRWESLQRDFNDYRITQRGYGGSFLDQLDAVSGYIVRPYRPSAILMWSGTNDVKVGGHSGAQVNDDFKIFVGNVRSQQPAVPVLFISIAPTPGYGTDPGAETRRRDANTLVQATCAADPTLHYVDIATFFEDVQANQPGEFPSYYSDDTHFSHKGYAVWKSIIRPQLEAILPPNKVVAANPAAPAAGQSVFFDFGPTDGNNGDSTTGADFLGHFWNNWHPTGGGGTVNAGEHLANLVKADGSNSGIRMTITGGYLVNGKLSGGLFAPQQSLLGDLAVETATEDFFYSTGDDLYNAGSDDVPGGFMLEGLNPALTYDFRVFGSRDSTETRITEYKISGTNEQAANLQTSGTDIGSNGIYDGNDDEVTVISGIKPDAFGQVFIDQTLIQGSFAYIGAMQITAIATTSALETWRSLHFTPEELGNPEFEASLYGNSADPDGDGRSNLLEYATGTDPRVAGPAAETVGMKTVGGDSLLTMTFQKYRLATDVIYQVEGAENLEDWDDVTDTPLSTSGDFEIRKASVSTTGFPNRFLRLKVRLAD